MEAICILLGFVFLLITHYCAYACGQQGAMLQAFQQDPRYRCGRDGMTLKDGDTFLGVVEGKHGPSFFIAHAGKEFNDA